jgi:DNA invertase Pin-like site-specific DNA recombinase
MLELSPLGAVGAEARDRAHQQWIEAARRAGRELTGFDPAAPLEQRIAWAYGAGLLIATIYTRFSTKHQNSTADQVRACVLYAAAHGMYVPPELICADEGVKGRKVRRDGLDRLKSILEAKQATVLLVYKLSRLFRQAHMGFLLVQQEVVDEGLRAVSVSQGIDTADEKSWKAQLQLHGLLDDLLVDAIADHVREGLIGLFKNGYVTGALSVGFRAVEVPGAPPTKLGRPRTMPQVDPEVAELILQHYLWVRDGMSLAEGLRRWRAAGGPCAPQATTGQMTYHAYRRMLTNVRYTGRWEFGRKRGRWLTKKDYLVQVPQPDDAVQVVQCEELRIIDDDLFWAVCKKVKARETGARPPRAVKAVRLEHILTDLFGCSDCQHRFYPTGNKSMWMKCTRPECQAPVCVKQADAVAAVCESLAGLLAADENLVKQVVEAAGRLNARGDDEVDAERAKLAQRIQILSRRIEDLTAMAGQGSEEDRAEMMLKVRSVQVERAAEKSALAKLERATPVRPVTESEIRQTLADFGKLLRDAGAGELGPDAVYKCAAVVRRLVNGRVWVHADRRPSRKRCTVRGVFTPNLLGAVAEAVGFSAPSAASTSTPATVEVWLRRPPKLDALAPEVRRLYEDEVLGFQEIGARLGISSGNAWLSYKRYYEMAGLPMPPRRPLNYRPRKAG